MNEVRTMTHHIGCPACASFAEYDSAEEAENAAESHNQSRHDGEDVARRIHPDSEEDVDAFVNESREKAPGKQHERVIRKIVRGESPYTVGVIGASK